MVLTTTLTLSKEEVREAMEQYIAARTKHPVVKINYRFAYQPSGPNESEPYDVNGAQAVLEVGL